MDLMVKRGELQACLCIIEVSGAAQAQLSWCSPS